MKKLFCLAAVFCCGFVGCAPAEMKKEIAVPATTTTPAPGAEMTPAPALDAPPAGSPAETPK